MMVEKLLTLTVAELAKELRVSPRHVWRMHSSGKLPLPVRLGRCIRWNRDEIQQWIAAGCPDRRVWQSMRIAG